MWLYGRCAPQATLLAVHCLEAMDECFMLSGEDDEVDETIVDRAHAYIDAQARTPPLQAHTPR